MGLDLYSPKETAVNGSIFVLVLALDLGRQRGVGEQKFRDGHWH
jgi:hypothetical protein